MTKLQGDRAKIDACTMQKQRGMYEHQGMPPRVSTYFMQELLEILESVLPTRLTDETFRGIMNFIKATKSDTTMDQIQKALVSTIEPNASIFYEVNEFHIVIPFLQSICRNICTQMCLI